MSTPIDVQAITPKTPNELMQQRCAMLEAQRDEAEELWQEAQALCAEYARDFGLLLRERDEDRAHIRSLDKDCRALEDAIGRLPIEQNELLARAKLAENQWSEWRATSERVAEELENVRNQLKNSHALVGRMRAVVEAARDLELDSHDPTMARLWVALDRLDGVDDGESTRPSTAPPSCNARRP